MRGSRISGTENYADEAPELLKRYESISFADAHAPVLQLLPPAPCRALDIGARTGRDAAGLLSLRHGPIPPGRRMFEVLADETIALAQRSNLFCTLNREAEASLRQPGVSWTRLAFRKDADRH